MSVLNPSFAGAVPFERCTDEENGVWVALTYQPPGDGPVAAQTPAVVSLDKPVWRTGNGPRYTQGGTVFLPRGLDRHNGDRFTFNGVKYYLIGAARGDHDHPFTGDDFGWVALSFEGSR